MDPDGLDWLSVRLCAGETIMGYPEKTAKRSREPSSFLRTTQGRWCSHYLFTDEETELRRKN